MFKRADYLKRTCGVTAWFKISEQGMTRHEVLSQASAAAVSNKSGSELWLFTSSHVVQPWRWRNYYPQEWIDFVRPEHCKYTLEIRDDKTGTVMETYRLDSDSLVSHPTRDVARLSLKADDEITWNKNKSRPIESVAFSKKELCVNDNVVVCGHAVEEFEYDSRESDLQNMHSMMGGDFHREDYSCYDSAAGDAGLRFQMPRAVMDSHFIACVGQQSFLQTGNYVLVDGMCGGPVLDLEDPNICHGLIEGIVPLQNPTHLAGCAAFIDSTELANWEKWK
jgi:hypothetical protein